MYHQSYYNNNKERNQPNSPPKCEVLIPCFSTFWLTPSQPSDRANWTASTSSQPSDQTNRTAATRTPSAKTNPSTLASNTHSPPPRYTPAMETSQAANSPAPPGSRPTTPAGIRLEQAHPPTAPPSPPRSALAHLRPQCSLSHSRAVAARPCGAPCSPRLVRRPGRRTGRSSNGAPRQTGLRSSRRG